MGDVSPHDAHVQFLLGMQVVEALAEANDQKLQLLWYQIRGSERWMETAGADPFCELLSIELLRTLQIKQWTSAERVKRMRAFAKLAEFIR
jgi:hypothetical protein